ncbi:DUF5304 family protein [Streptomyces sp. TRM 70351]|uniref:DUF5304 family protein n=1 Tax=Streptomyces sp. TRM 70351 TaxID=3116552 RepID=UPI002E7B1CD2|nr:DUF5304 family protein [Streptomyces sp. TRM 70351]MEE1928702.1 DUF5304 family protein [Streptomyces sp. TRM 70351]
MSDAAGRDTRKSGAGDPGATGPGAAEAGTAGAGDASAGAGAAGPGAPDADAWADACAEDLAAERDRRRERYGSGGAPGGAAEELRRLAETVAGRLADLAGPLTGGAAQGEQWARQLVDGARAAARPVLQRNPDVVAHLSAAGSELLAAYRSAVADSEQRWTRTPDGTTAPAPGQREDPGAPPSRERSAEPPGTERIDLE